MNNLSRLNAALEYAAHGFPVFPLNGKKPALKTMGKNFENATTDPDIIRDWWGGPYVHCNIGIPTGERSGIWTLDIDNKPTSANGFSSLQQIISKNGELPPTASQTTGTGQHYLFQSNEMLVNNSASKIAAGIDVRGQGGYIVVAPSIHPDTKNAYQWKEGLSPFDIGISAAPDWLVNLATNDNYKSVGQRTNLDSEPIIGNNGAESILGEECKNIESAANGTQDTTLNKAAFCIGQLVGTNDLQYSDAFTALMESALKMVSYDP